MSSTELFHTLNMVNATVINHKHTAGTWIRIHSCCEIIEILQEFITLVAANLDMAVDNTINRNSG